MLSGALIVLALSMQDASADLPDAAQFQRLVIDPYATFPSFEFTYEGTTYQTDVPGRETALFRFQGCYAQSQSGDTHLELYKMSPDGLGEFRHLVVAMVKNEISEIRESPDHAPASREAPLRYRGRPGSLLRPGSPEFFVSHWLFRQIRNVEAVGYQALGWEVIDGHVCLKVSLNVLHAANDTPVPKRILWLDLKRGGTPLRVEVVDADGRPRWVAHGIKLQEFQSGPTTYWFPIFGIMDEFHVDDPSRTDPVARTRAGIVNGSVRLAPAFPSDRFNIEYSANPSSGFWEPVRGRYADAARSASKAVPRMDPAGVRERVEEKLREADRAANLVTATPPSATRFGPTVWLQWLLMLIGLAAIALALRWRKRQG